MGPFQDLNPDDYRLPDELTGQLSSPALIVFVDRVRANVRRVLEACGGPERWQPHVKTSKIPHIWRELVDAGLTRFKCATTREAELLARVLEERGVQGAEVLCAYPLVGPGLTRLGEIALDHPAMRFDVLCEDPGAVEEVPGHLGIYVDVNPGMDRTGVPLAKRHVSLEVARSAGERFRGVHAYDGHHHASGEAARRREVHAGYDSLLELLEQLEQQGTPPPGLITAGTPAFLQALTYEPFADLDRTRHRVSPGTVVFHDVRSAELNPDFPLEPAALVFTRVVSRPTPSRITLDAGSKSLAAEAGDPCAWVLGHPHLVPRTPSEEHLPCDVAQGPMPGRGQELLLVPRHVCPTVNLAEEAVLVEGGQVREIVPVSARAHETRIVARSAR